MSQELRVLLLVDVLHRKPKQVERFYDLLHEYEYKHIKCDEKAMNVLEAMINKVGFYAKEARSKDPTQPYEETDTEEGGYSCRTLLSRPFP
jgi:hypothetical protein